MPNNFFIYCLILMPILTVKRTTVEHCAHGRYRFWLVSPQRLTIFVNEITKFGANLRLKKGGNVLGAVSLGNMYFSVDKPF